MNLSNNLELEEPADELALRHKNKDKWLFNEQSVFLHKSSCARKCMNIVF